VPVIDTYREHSTCQHWWAPADPHMKAFYETTLSRNKASLQALVAVTKTPPCNLRHISKSKDYDGSKLFPTIIPA